MKQLKITWTEYHSATVLADDDSQEEVEAIVRFKLEADKKQTPDHTLVAYDDVKIEKETQ